MGRLSGKRALITGARKGIGRGIALTLAGEGANVGINDLVDDEVTQHTRDLIESHGVRGSVHRGDVSTVDGIHAVLDAFVESHGGIDILVNNAIIPDQDRSLFEVDEEFWDRMMNLTLKGYFFAAQRAARHMVDQGTGGRIVCLASVHAYQAWKDWTAYGVAKAGLRRMAKALAIDPQSPKLRRHVAGADVDQIVAKHRSRHIGKARAIVDLPQRLAGERLVGNHPMGTRHDQLPTSAG